jgi:hypothetical protein
MSLLMDPSGGGNDNHYDHGGTAYGVETAHVTGVRAGRNPEQDSGDEFMAEMAKIRQNQVDEGVPTGKYKQKLEEARRETVTESDPSYKYPGYKARRRASLSAEEPPAVPTPASAGPSGDVFSQVRTRRQEDLLKASRARKKTKEKKKAFGDQIKGVLAYLPFRTSHLSGFDG